MLIVTAHLPSSAMRHGDRSSSEQSNHQVKTHDEVQWSCEVKVWYAKIICRAVGDLSRRIFGEERRRRCHFCLYIDITALHQPSDHRDGISDRGP